MDTARKINKVELRNLRMEDYDQLAKSFRRIYANHDVFWTHKQIKKLITIFPEGQVVIIADDKIVGCALSIIVDYNMVQGDHTYAQVTGNETFDTHNPNGNILYGIEVFIHPDYRGLRLGRRMYEYRKELCEKLNLKAIMFGGRIPNYHKYADKMRPKEYIEKVRSREIYDPVLNFQLSNDFHVRRVIRNYLPNDEESCHCACLLQWDNIYYQPPTEQKKVERKPTVRLGMVQWQMRPYKDVDDLMEQVEFFVDSVSSYKADFVVFPEYFNAPLMAPFNKMGEAQSIRALAQYTEKIREEQGGTYGVSVSADLNDFPVQEAVMSIRFRTDPTQYARLIPMVYQVLKDMAEKGPDVKNLDKVKEYETKTYGQVKIMNNYWETMIHDYLMHDIDFDSNYLGRVKALTVDDIRSTAKKLLASGHRIEVTMSSSAQH